MTSPEATTPTIRGFHAHVYFGPDTVEQARSLCSAAAEKFEVAMGRVHEKPVGPHPDWSCQLAFQPEVFGQLIPWLAMHRGGLVVFVHPISDNQLIDHRDRALWMGAVRPLDLSVLPDGPGD
jgi:aromatic ring-cleaving dioxygenase